MNKESTRVRTIAYIVSKMLHVSMDKAMAIVLCTNTVKAIKEGNLSVLYEQVTANTYDVLCEISAENVALQWEEKDIIKYYHEYRAELIKEPPFTVQFAPISGKDCRIRRKRIAELRKRVCNSKRREKNNRIQARRISR